MSRRKPTPGPAMLPPLPAPAPTVESLAAKAEVSERLKELLADLTEKNLLRTRRLVELALRGQAPPELVYHLSMVGKNYYNLADNGPPRPSLRVIKGRC